MSAAVALVPVEVIDRRIYIIRNQRVMLDRDLAVLYGVKPIALRQQVKRNPERFREDFMFQLSAEEADLLVSQNVTPSRSHFGGSLPLAFTEQGVATLSSVLASKRAIAVNVAIMRAVVRMRELMLTHEELFRKIQDMELKYDEQFQTVFEAIRDLIEPPEPPRRPIGFVPTA